MKTTSSSPPPPSSTKKDEIRSRASEIIQAHHRQSSRRSHVSISSNKRPSVNTSGGHSTKTRQGMFQRAVPIMPRALAILCFILNLILPGTGNSTDSSYSFDHLVLLFIICRLSLFYQQICMFSRR